LKWLKKTDEIGMPTAIKDVINALAALRQSTPDQIQSLIEANFFRLIANDPWISQASQFIRFENQ
jgi:Tat protein secretion system quality control protein TatD with DNase activity